MGVATGEDTRQLIGLARMKLGMSQAEFGDKLNGVNRRTVQRWESGGVILLDQHWQKLARMLYPLDVGLAQRAARCGDTTVEALGLTPKPPAPPPPPEPVGPPPRPRPSATLLVDSVVCAAAEAFGIAPKDLRPLLIAPFRRAAELELDPGEVADVLAGRLPAAAEPAKKSKRLQAVPDKKR
jgi:DNA-binding XRE family transcriptional regulator